MNWSGLEKFVKQNPNKINQTEWNRVCELHDSNPNFDVDAYCLVHMNELMAVENTAFSQDEEDKIKKKLSEYGTITLFDHMAKDENCRDDLKIQVKYNNKTVTIWYLKMFNGESIEYCCLYPKISHNYYDFEGLIKDIESVLNTKGPWG